MTAKPKSDCHSFCAPLADSVPTGRLMDKYSTWLILFGGLLALGAGGVMALQPAVNGKLATQCSHPLQASLISFATGLLAISVVGLVMQIGLPNPSRLVELPWWAWGGGLLGTYMVTVSLLIAPRLGATRWLVLVLAGQVTLSIVLDHFGWLGYPQHSVSWQRIIGVALLVAGVFIVMRH